MKRSLLIILLLVSAIALVACGRVTIAEHTVTATWTPSPTPLPTATMTPVAPPSTATPAIPPATTTPIVGPRLISFTSLGLTARIDGIQVTIPTYGTDGLPVWDANNMVAEPGRVRPEWAPGGLSACGVSRDESGHEYVYIVGCTDGQMNTSLVRMIDIQIPAEIPSGTYEQVLIKAAQIRGE